MDDKVIEEMALRDTARQLVEFWAQDSGTSLHMLAAEQLNLAADALEEAQACASIVQKRIEGLVTAAERVDAYIRELGDFAGPDEQPIECFRQLRDALAALSPVGVTEA